jgi:hypothetical protein
MKKFITTAAVLVIGAATLAGCSIGEKNADEKAVNEKAAKFKAYIPKNNVELDNYNKAQELYDDPAAIQWCSAFPSSNSAPIVTLPIAGKLTTSATSYFSPTEAGGNANGTWVLPKRSVDGLYHGDSFYRYGFTPAGQYVDFSNSLELLCTTSLTEFQRQNTYVEGVDTKGDVDANQKAAEKALKDGDGKKAAEILGGK